MRDKSQTSPHPQNPRIRIGTAGWSIPQTSAADFPSAGSHLKRYANVLSCCEINSSFYRAHKTKTWKRWASSVPPGFKFSVKAPRTITHETQLRCSSGMLMSVFEQISHLSDKLGPVLFQLPPSLKFSEEIVRTFLTMLREMYAGAIVWEPRHASWFHPPAEDLLRQFKISRVAADPYCVPEARNPGGRSRELVYFRLHGSPRKYYSAYSPDFIQNLARNFQQSDPEPEIWCIFDNTAAGAATINAIELAKLQSELSKITG